MRPLEDAGCEGISCIPDAIGDIVNGAQQTLGFFSDPWGNTFKMLQDSAVSITKDILPALTAATMPDLSAEWFLRAYAVSFALAIFVAMLLLLADTVRASRGLIAGSELMGSMTEYFPLFLIGAMFGPWAGWFIVQLVHALSSSIIAWGITSSVEGTIGALQTMISEVNVGGVAGGVVVAVGLMLCMVLALIVVTLIQIVMLVTLYLVGVLIPLGLVWIIRSTKRAFGLKLLTVWGGVLVAHPILFFLLSVTFTFIASSTDFAGSLELQTFVKLITAVVAIAIAGLSPMLLMKFAPIIPGATGVSAANLSMPSGGSWGSRSVHESVSTTTSQSESSESGTSTTTSTSSAAPEASEYDDAVTAGTGTAAKSATAGSAAGGSAAAASGAAESAAGSAAGGASVAEAGVAAGAAESATGVGAAVGIPTIAAALTVGAVASGVQKGVDYSVAPMDEAEVN